MFTELPSSAMWKWVSMELCQLQLCLHPKQLSVYLWNYRFSRWLQPWWFQHFPSRPSTTSRRCHPCTQHCLSGKLIHNIYHLYYWFIHHPYLWNLNFEYNYQSWCYKLIILYIDFWVDILLLRWDLSSSLSLVCSKISARFLSSGLGHLDIAHLLTNQVSLSSTTCCDGDRDWHLPRVLLRTPQRSDFHNIDTKCHHTVDSWISRSEWYWNLSIHIICYVLACCYFSDTFSFCLLFLLFLAQRCVSYRCWSFCSHVGGWWWLKGWGDLHRDSSNPSGAEGCLLYGCILDEVLCNILCMSVGYEKLLLISSSHSQSNSELDTSILTETLLPFPTFFCWPVPPAIRI